MTHDKLASGQVGFKALKVQVRMSITQLETHVTLKRGIQVADHEPFTCTQETGQAQEGRAEQRESFRAELGEGPSLEDKKPEEKNKMLHKLGRCQVTGDRE